MNNRFQILALDGGGIKGIFSAAILAYFEDDFNTRISDHFDLIVGTSTGGIIAMALGLGLRPKEILEFYVNEGSNIFEASMLSGFRQYFTSKYEAKGLRRALHKYFGEKKLADSVKRLVIPSYNLGEDDVYLFKTPHHERLKRDHKVPMWKVAMATSAAPTYFPCFDEVDSVRLVDGGVWANNPVLVGITEARSLLNVRLDDMQVLNVGTTDEVRTRAKTLNKGGFWQWRMEAVSVIMNGQGIGAFTTAKHLVGEDKVFRISPKVPDGLFNLDRVTTNELIAKAAHRSRHFAPIFNDNFLKHVAPKYEPLNK